MNLLRLLAVVIMLIVPLVYSCEGDCIVQITKAICGNYTVVATETLMNVEHAVLPCASNNRTGLTFLQPILSAFEEQCYEAVRQAFFPGCFHGKCQRNGVDPPGCPNPCCPVICGTPGSIACHYDSLGVYVAFKAVQKLLHAIACASSIVLPPGQHHCERAFTMLRFMRSVSVERRNPLVALSGALLRKTDKRNWMVPRLEKGLPEDQDIGLELENLELGRPLRGEALVGRKAEEEKCKNSRLESEVVAKLDAQCGGQNLTNCRWSKEMKEFVLGFP